MTVKVINDQKQYNEMTLYDITAKDTHQYKTYHQNNEKRR